MSSLTNYGQAVASTTLALQHLLESTPIELQVTARTLSAARVGISGASVNLFLYSDGLIAYREATALHGPSRLIAELHYLVSAHPGDEADTDAVSQRAFGTARATIERNAELTVPIGSERMRVWLTPSPLTLQDGAALWQASGAPLSLSFGVMASFTVDAAVRAVTIGTIADVVTLAPAGTIAVFSGADGPAKSLAAASVAKELGKALVTVPLGEIVSVDPAATERNLARLFDGAAPGGAVLLIDEADALFGVRPEMLDLSDPYAEVEVSQVLDLFGRASGVVIIPLRDSVGPELADRAAIEVRFPEAGAEAGAETSGEGEPK
jgi:hypothetical protein